VYGGGGAYPGYGGGYGGSGAVRLVWKTGASFPSTNVGA
jgi:hypothetical protein